MSENSFAGAIGIVRGRIDKRAAGLQECCELLLGNVFVNCLAPLHRPQGEARDFEAGASQASIVHGHRLIGILY